MGGPGSGNHKPGRRRQAAALRARGLSLAEIGRKRGARSARPVRVALRCYPFADHPPLQCLSAASGAGPCVLPA